MSNSTETEVIVIGAGLAGLAAALRLRERGIDCIVLEARERVGGRVLSAPIGGASDGTNIGISADLGAQWISSQHRRIIGLLDRYGLHAAPTYAEGRTIYRLNGKTMHGNRPGTPPLPLIGRMDVRAFQHKLRKLSASLDMRAPWGTSRGEQLDTETIHTWLGRSMRTKSGQAYVRLLTEEGLCCELGEVSVLDFAWSLSASGGKPERIFDAEELWLPCGAQTLPDRMAASLGDAVRLGRPVRLVEWSDEQAAVTAVCGERWHGRRVIVAVPPVFAGRIAFDPPLPSGRDQLTQRVGHGSVVKSFAVYERPFWRERGLNGTAYSDEGAVTTTLDSTPPDRSFGVLAALAAGRAARALSALDEAGRRNAVLGRLAELFGPNAPAPIGYLDKDWNADPWARGGYAAHFAPGVLRAYGPALLEPIGPIHWAGTETAAEWRLYMEGAVQSGERAAREAGDALRRPAPLNA